MTALIGVRTRLHLAKVLLVTDIREEAGDLADFADAALAGGVDLIEIRDGSVSREELRTAIERVQTVSSRYQGLVGVRDDADLAGAVGADVLQLSGPGMSARAARRSLSPFALIGRTCRTSAEVDAALADREVDFLTVGPVFDGLRFIGHTPGVELIQYAAGLADPADEKAKPWFAGGGITAGNLEEVLAAGARRVIVGRAIGNANDPAEASRRIKDHLREAWNADPSMERYSLAVLADAGSAVRGAFEVPVTPIG